MSTRPSRSIAMIAAYVVAAAVVGHAQRAPDLMQAASRAEDAGRWTEAFNGYMAALKALPSAAPPADALVLRTRVVRVVTHLPIAPPIPLAAQTHVKLGAQAVQQSDAARAEQEFRLAVQSAPWYAGALYNLAVAEEELGKPGLALDELKLYLLLAVPDANQVRAHVQELEARDGFPANRERGWSSLFRWAAEDEVDSCTGEPGRLRPPDEARACFQRTLSNHREHCAQGFGFQCMALENLENWDRFFLDQPNVQRKGHFAAVLMEACNAGSAESCELLESELPVPPCLGLGLNKDPDCNGLYLLTQEDAKKYGIPSRNELNKRYADLYDRGCTLGNGSDCYAFSTEFYGDPPKNAALKKKACEAPYHRVCQ